MTGPATPAHPEARVSSRSVGALVRQRLRPEEDDWNLALVQRDRVWDSVRVRRLMDSLLAGYPIGSLLVCAIAGHGEGLDPDTRGVIRIEPGADQLLDGQQRIAAMLSLFAGQGDLGRFFLHMTAIRPRDELAIRRRNRSAVTDYIKWRRDLQELEYRPIRDRGRYLDLAELAAWADIDDPADTRANAALRRLESALSTASQHALNGSIDFLTEIDSLHEAPAGSEDVRREAGRAAALLRAWLRPVPVERHVFADKIDILQAFERVNLEGVRIAGDDIFFAAVKTAWSNADRGLHSLVERVPVVSRIGALRVLGRLASLSAGQGDLIPLRVERLNGDPGDEIVARLASLVVPGSPAVERMAAISDRLTGPGGLGYALSFVPGPLVDDVLGWAATSEWIDGGDSLPDETLLDVATYLVGAAAFDYWPIFGETYATRSFVTALVAGLRGDPFPTSRILRITKHRWPELRQGRRRVPQEVDLANRHQELFLSIAQRLPFRLPQREGVDPLGRDVRVEVEWDHIWPQAKASRLRVRRATTEGSRSVWRAGNLWALDRPLNTSASAAWPSEKLAFLSNPPARHPALPNRWPPADRSFLDPEEEELLRAAEARVRGPEAGGVAVDVAYAADAFARFVSGRGERLVAHVIGRYPDMLDFGRPDSASDEQDPARPDPAELSVRLGLAAPPRRRAVPVIEAGSGTRELAIAIGLVEEYDTVIAAIVAHGLRVVDYHRDGVAKWAKVGLPDPGKQARALFWVVPEADGPALAFPHELGAFKDLLGIEPSVTRSLFGAERPLIRRGGAMEFIERRLARLLSVRRGG